MTLHAFIQRLDNPQFELDAEQVLDALWLASLGCDLSLHGTGPRGQGDGLHKEDAAKQRAPDREWRKAEAPPGRPPAAGAHAPRRLELRDPNRPGRTPVFPRGLAPEGAAARRASPVTLPAPRPLPDRLALMRALKPLARRRPSRLALEVDEEKTAEACAELALARVNLVVPVMRPRQERWFDVEVVLEDDPTITLWEDTLAEFADVLRDTGAFGQVRQWRLRLPPSGRGHPYLVNALGMRATPMAFTGKNTRRLLVFASQGSSVHWTDGRYAAVLGPWLRDNAVVLLQLAPPERWVRGTLGDPHGTASATSAGAPASALHIHPQWWRLPKAAETPTSLPLPVIALVPDSLARWANMQMAKGQDHPVYLLETALARSGASGAMPAPQTRAAAPNIERSLALLKYESPDSFRLAVLLSNSPFTLSVARLVQAITFPGNSDPSMLAELMRSGLVVARDGSQGIADEVYYALQPGARQLVQQSLRDVDATGLAWKIKAELSRQLERLGPGGVRSAQLVADEEGTHALPEWAQAFATVANGLLGLPEDSSVTTQRVEDLLRRISNAAAQAIARLAASREGIQPAAVGADAWAELLAARLVYQREDGGWAFAPGVRKLVEQSMAAAGGSAAQADLLAAALDVLQSMALAFHMSHIVDGPKGLRIREILDDWDGEQGAALEHLLYVTEYVFSQQISKALISGADPIRVGEPDDDRKACLEAVRALRYWATVQSVQEKKDFLESVQLKRGSAAKTVQARSVPHGADALRLAMRLLWMREPADYQQLVDAGTDAAVRQFAENPGSPQIVDMEWWRTKGSLMLDWLERPEVVAKLSVYCGRFFKNFQRDRWSRLALSEDYASYVVHLLTLWQNATEVVFKRARPHSQLLTMHYRVEAESLAQVKTQFPQYTSAIRAEVAEYRQWAMSWTAYLALIDELGNVLQPALARRLQSGYRKPHVLWVDDNPRNIERDRDYLSDLDIEFSFAGATDQAISLCRSHLYDAVISDMARTQDRYAGLRLLQQLRRAANRVPFVIYSSVTDTPEMAEALDWGAVGVANESSQLRSLLVRALLRTDAALDRPVDELSLLEFTRRQFPEMSVSADRNATAVEIIDEDEFPNLLSIDHAIERARPAMQACMEAAPGAFLTGTDLVAVSLSLASRAFMEQFDFAPQALDAVFRFSSLVQGNAAGIADDARAVGHGTESTDASTALAMLRERIRRGKMGDLHMEIGRELRAVLESTPWEAIPDTHLFYEVGHAHASLLGWAFASEDEDMLELAGADRNSVIVGARILLTVQAEADFIFSIKDFVDKDMVDIGRANVTREIAKEVQARIRLERTESGTFEVESVEIGAIPGQLHFGHVEPDFDDPADLETLPA